MKRRELAQGEGIRAAIYARRSTEEHQAESLETQLDGARRFIGSQPWQLDEGHIFIDSGVSRAEFVKRPGLIAMLRAIEDGDIDVVVCRDETRLGGDTFLTGQLIGTIREHARLFYYFTAEEVVIDGALSKVMVSLRNFASELEREKISQRTREHLDRKARRGLVAGGKVYGYTNQPAPEGHGKVRVIDPAQRDIVHEIFKRYAAGEGLRGIAHSLNARKVPPPRDREWMHTAVRSILLRPLYIGRIEWGHTHKSYRGGTKVRTRQHNCEKVIVDAPHLRIVDDELWAAVQHRFTNRLRKSKGGRPATYLMSGVLRCAACGGAMTALNGRDGEEAVKVYACGRRRDRGGTACDARGRMRVDAVEGAVLGWVKENILTEQVLRELILEMRRRTASRNTQNEAEARQLEVEVEKLQADIDRCAEAALAAPVGVRDVFYGKLAEKKTALDAASTRLRVVKTAPAAIDLELRRLERDALGRLKDLQKVVGRADPAAARAFIRTLFPDGLKATPVRGSGGAAMRLEGEAAPGLALALDLDGKLASPAGYVLYCMSKGQGKAGPSLPFGFEAVA